MKSTHPPARWLLSSCLTALAICMLLAGSSCSHSTSASPQPMDMKSSAFKNSKESQSPTANPPRPDRLVDCPPFQEQGSGQQQATLVRSFQFIGENGIAWQRQVHQENTDAGLATITVMDVAEGHQELLPRLVSQQSIQLLHTTAQANDLSADVIQLLKDAPALPTPLLKTKNPLWSIERNWDANEELLYNQWIEKTANINFLVGSGLVVDCAKFAMALRWIYAHDRHLPMAATLTATGELIGSWESTSKWDQLAGDENWRNDRKFKTALQYIVNASFTHSLLKDLYPVKISRETIVPGTIYLTLFHASGHTRTIIHAGTDPRCFDGNGCLVMLWGDEPASDKGYLDIETPSRQDRGQGGLLRFRWPVQKADKTWILQAAKDMPNYSDEQYKWSEDQFRVSVENELKFWNSPSQLYLSSARALLSKMQDRLQLTEEGYFLCSLVPCAKSDALFDDWSTPDRDSQLQQSLQNLRQLQGTFSDRSADFTGFTTHNSSPFLSGFPYSSIDMLSRLDATQWSSDPSADFWQRWGLNNPPLSTQLFSLGEVIWHNWQRRETSVAEAHESCNATDKKGTCTTQNLQKDWQTSRLDQGFRKALQLFQRLYATASTDLREQVETQLSHYSTRVLLCHVDGVHCPLPCTMRDLLLTEPEHLRQMSANPNDDYRKRFGF